MVRRVVLAAAALAAVHAAPAPAAEVVALAPARVAATAQAGLVAGPFGLLNTTVRGYDVRVTPVMLGQRRDGAFAVLDSSQARRWAARHVALSGRRFALPAGASRSVGARLRRVPPDGSFYGGVLFTATPRTAGRGSEQLLQVVRLNASLRLAPRRRRVALSAGKVAVTQAGPGRLRLAVPVVNHGNGLERVTGIVRVRAADGRVVLRKRLRSRQILPGATVDLVTSTARRLPAGGYSIAARVQAPGGRRARALGAMRLFGAGQVRTVRMRLADLRAGPAYRGRELEVLARVRNTGNVAHSPGGGVTVRGPGWSVTRRLAGEPIRPGHAGELRTTVDLPDAAGPFEVVARVGGERKVLTVSAAPRPSLTVRGGAWVRGHAVGLVGLLAALLVGGAVAGTLHVRRLRRTLTGGAKAAGRIAR